MITRKQYEIDDQEEQRRIISAIQDSIPKDVQWHNVIIALSSVINSEAVAMRKYMKRSDKE